MPTPFSVKYAGILKNCEACVLTFSLIPTLLKKNLGYLTWGTGMAFSRATTLKFQKNESVKWHFAEKINGMFTDKYHVIQKLATILSS